MYVECCGENIQTDLNEWTNETHFFFPTNVICRSKSVGNCPQFGVTSSILWDNTPQWVTKQSTQGHHLAWNHQEASQTIHVGEEND